MMRFFQWAGTAIVVLASASEVRGDLLEYRVVSGMLLQGKVTINPGGTTTLNHRFGTLYFKTDDIKRYKVPTLTQQFATRLTKAKKDADAMFDAGVWALKHGLLDEFYQAVDAALQANPKHEAAKRIKGLRAQMAKPLGTSSVQEAELRKFLTKKDMKIATSDHFILMYDTPDKPDKSEKGRKPRHEERLDLLEKVYASFLLTFFSHGVPLEVPKERLKVVLFNQHADYLDFSRRLDPFLVNASGYYTHDINVSVFFDHGSSDRFKVLQDLSGKLQKLANDAIKKNVPGKGELRRLANSITMLIRVEQEGNDVEVVSHEATHQVAANTGLFPRNVRIPRWVHEGLATYFESPNNGAWSGIGAVNEQRLGLYRALERDRDHSNIDFIVGDQIFDYAGSVGSFLHGYGQAWAFTHFLIEKHFDEFIRYYKELGDMPPDVILGPELLTTLFNRAFGTDRGALDSEWRSYMRSLKTDIELILAEEK
jgi:hypothetical protein